MICSPEDCVYGKWYLKGLRKQKNANIFDPTWYCGYYDTTQQIALIEEFVHKGDECPLGMTREEAEIINKQW